MRLPDDQSYDGQRANGIRVGYYDYLKDGVLAPPALIPVRGDVVDGNPDVAVPVTVGGPYVPRRARITKADLVKYGFTPGCPACLSAQLEDGIRMGGHSEECRKRIEMSMPGEKVDRAQARIDQWTSTQVEQGEKPMETENEPASRSGLTEKEREETPTILDDGRVVRSEISESRREDQIPEPAPLEQAPIDPSERRFRTPDRPAATKRRPVEDGDAEHLRRRIATPESDVMDDGLAGDPDSPLAQWYDGTQAAGDPDQSMSFLDETDRRILASVIMNVDITEIYSPTRVNRVAAKFGLCAGSSMDLTNGWDFSKESDRRKAWKVIKETRPFIIIGSPPCTMFSNLQEMNKHVHRHDEAWLKAFEERKQEAVMHLRFCAILYNYQLRHGYHFLHEHPWSAKSWMIPEIQELLQKPNVELVETHLCRFGMQSHWESKEGDKGLAKKPTGFMTSAPRVAEKLAKRCTGGHEHVHLMGGRAAAAQIYPDPLCHAIAEGVLEQKRDDAKNVVELPKMDSVELKKFVGFLGVGVGETVRAKNGIGYPIGDWPDNWVDPIHEEAGGSDCFGLRPQNGIELLRAHMDALNWKDGIATAKDDVSGKDLVSELVMRARAEEMDYFRKLGVYEVVPRSMQKVTGGKIIGTRWVDVNKGDIDNPNCRSRFVGREINVGRDDTLYAATPPLEALRVVLSHAATRKKGKGVKSKAK